MVVPGGHHWSSHIYSIVKKTTTRCIEPLPVNDRIKEPSRISPTLRERVSRMNSTEKDSHDTGYLNPVSKVFATNRLLKSILFLMLIFQILQYLDGRSMRQNWEQTLIPPCPTEPYRVSRSHASENYIVDMSHYIVALWGNVSPTSVDDKYNILLGMFAEESYPRYKDRLNEISKEIKKYTTISHMMDIQAQDPISILDNHLQIRIKRYRVVGSTVMPPTVGTLEIDFRIEGGRFKIIDMEEKS